MKGSIIITASFVMGCLSGYFGLLPTFIVRNDATEYVLYLLMFLVGVSIGGDRKLSDIAHTVSPKMLWIPAATITGTLAFSALAGLCMSRWSIPECMAVGSGFAYYSLSSILITRLKETSVGTDMAAELGTIALMANIIREITTLLLAPLIAKYFGKLAPICAGGATTMDTTLPVIIRYSGKDMTMIAVFHGITVDLSVPFLVSFFCSL